MLRSTSTFMTKGKPITESESADAGEYLNKGTVMEPERYAFIIYL